MSTRRIAFDDRVLEARRAIIRDALTVTNNNRVLAAKHLGIHRSHLYYWLKLLRFDRKQVQNNNPEGVNQWSKPPLIRAKQLRLKYPTV